MSCYLNLDMSLTWPCPGCRIPAVDLCVQQLPCKQLINTTILLLENADASYV